MPPSPTRKPKKKWKSKRGETVSQKTQQRLVQRQTFEEVKSDVPVEQMSLDGGMIRLRTPKGGPAEWKEFKAINLMNSQQGMAWFKDNEALLAWANGLSLAARVDCLGDGHDGVWGLYEKIGDVQQRNEILDWDHLMENLHRVPGSNSRLFEAESLLWKGELDATIRLFESCNCDEARTFRGYLERHRSRIPNYGYYQAEGIPIGSGDVESLIKQISVRTKLSGASWDAHNVPQVLAHRCAYLNGSLAPQHKLSL